MVQINLRKENYDKAIRHGVTDINEWINKVAEKELADDTCATDTARKVRDTK